MPKKSGWDLLLAGKYRSALKLLKAEHKSHPCTGSLNNIGIAYLCMGNAKAATKFFDEAVLAFLAGSVGNDLGGVARWMSNERAEAARIWCAGLDSDYADGAGGIELPLLLFYAAARDPKIFSMTQAKKLIRNALKHRMATNWPGPLGRFVLNRIDEDKVRREAEFDQPDVQAAQMNQVEFWAGILACLRGDRKEFRKRMRRCASTVPCNLDHEWHLARYEINDFSPVCRKPVAGASESSTPVEPTPEMQAEARAFWKDLFQSTKFITRKLSVEEAETEFAVRLKPFGNKVFAFGFLNPEWEQLKAKMCRGDQIWEFETEWRGAKHRGVKLLRKGKAIDAIGAEVTPLSR